MTQIKNDEVAEDSESEAFTVICGVPSSAAEGMPWSVRVALSNEHQLGRFEVVYERAWSRSVENVNWLKDQV